MMAGGLLFAANSACAQSVQKDDAEIRAENARLREQIEKLRPAADPRSENARLIQELEALKARNSPAVAESPPVAAPADSGALEAVTVRGRRNVLAPLKETPRSVSIVSGTELAKQDTVNFRDFVTRIGNVGMGYNNPQAASLTIRGVGWASGVGQLDPSVGMNVDGESYGTGAIAASTNFIDVESVDVVRGPQGTLGGKNSSIGQISIRTRQPSFTPEASASITYGQRNTLRTQAVFGGAVIPDLLAWRGTFYREQADGQEANANEKKTTFQNRDRTFGRVQFLLTPSSDFNARLSLEMTPTMNENGSYLEFPRPTPEFYDTRDANGDRIRVNQALEQAGRLSRPWFAQERNYSISKDLFGDRINQLNQVPSKYSTKGGNLTLNWNVGEHRLQSITGYRDYYFDNGISSAGPNTVFDIDRSPTPGHVEYWQASQEFRLSSPTGGLFDYTTGIYLYHNRMPDRRTQTSYGGDAGAYYANLAQYNRLDGNGNGNGRYLLVNSLDRLYVKTKDDIRNDSIAFYGNTNFRPTEQLTLNGGLRLTFENRRTRSQRLIENEGYGAELDPAQVNNVQLGGFDSGANGALTANNSAAQIAVANAVALKYFGVAQYSALTPAQRQQVADAKSIRAGRVGGLYLNSYAEPFQQWLPTATFSPIYKFDADNTGYLTYQHGEKAGVAQIVGATAAGGKSIPLKAERTDSFEAGWRTALLDRSLTLNADVFLTKIHDYIQPMYFEDKAQTLINNDGKIAYSSGLGNVPSVRTRGLELDAVYTGIGFTTLRLAGAYNDARYVSFPTLAKPAELGGSTTPYYDASGKTLPGAPKFSLNANADYTRPVLADKLFHANANYRYTSSYNNDPSLSRYAVAPPAGIVDLAVGLGTRDGQFDLTLLAKNLLNNDYGFYTNWIIYAPSTKRWFGVMLSTRL